MKTLGIYDLEAADSLFMTFEANFGSQKSLENELGPLFQVLEDNAGEWMPDVVDGNRMRKYSRASIWKSLKEGIDKGHDCIGLYRTSWPALDMSLTLWLSSPPPGLTLSIRLKPISFFEAEDRCQRFVELVRAWANHYPVSYAAVHSLADRQLTGAPDFGRDGKVSRRDGFDRIYEVFWLNVLGPKLVESVGRERVLSAPAHRVEEFPNGSVLLTTWPTLVDFASEAARLAQARVFVHLRPELDLATVLNTLRERSAMLAPVQPRFPPDVAPLLSRVVDGVAFYQRQRRIAELNAWQPPEPEEWLSTTASFPTDVTDPEQARAYYGDLAEGLVAMLHTKVPSVFKASPESLTDVDFQFWRDEFPRRFERERIDAHAVPAVGAYLGEVLVRHLGGQWIPRLKLEETQVRVGTRVWLPFIRAWHYLRSCQSLLDFSLTQLYRVAERHRS